MGQVVFSRCFAVNKNGGCLLLRARVYCVSNLAFLLSPFTSLEWRKWFSNRHETWPSTHLSSRGTTFTTELLPFQQGRRGLKKVPRFFELLPLPYEKLPFLFCGKRAMGEQKTGASEYFSRNTRVLLWQYSSTAPRVLEYFRESTAVLSLKYWDAAVSHVFLCGLFEVCYCTAKFFWCIRISSNHARCSPYFSCNDKGMVSVWVWRVKVKMLKFA